VALNKEYADFKANFTKEEIKGLRPVKQDEIEGFIKEQKTLDEVKVLKI